LQLSQAVQQDQIALEEQQECLRSTASAATSCSLFNSAYTVPQSKDAMGREYVGPKGNMPQNLLDISGIHLAIRASHEMN
jgi:hypothetical protein